MSQEGYIYVLANASMPGQLKIGKTTKIPEQRARQLQGTGVATPFVVVHKEYVMNIACAEKEVHTELAEYRVNPKREFFEVTSAMCIPIVQAICKKHKRLLLDCIKLGNELDHSNVVISFPANDSSLAEQIRFTHEESIKLEDGDLL